MHLFTYLFRWKFAQQRSEGVLGGVLGVLDVLGAAWSSWP
jgi:hypothetical protein